MSIRLRAEIFFNLVFLGDFFRLQHIQLLYMHGIAHHAVLLKYDKVQCISPGVNQTQTSYFIQVTFLGEIFRLTHISNCRNTLHCSSCSIAQMWSSSVYFSWCQSKQRFSSHTHQLEHITLLVMQCFEISKSIIGT